MVDFAQRSEANMVSMSRMQCGGSAPSIDRWSILDQRKICVGRGYPG